MHNLAGAVTMEALPHIQGHWFKPLVCLAYHSFW